MAFDIDALGEPLDGRYAAEVAVDAVDLLRVLLPEWLPRNASPEVIYLEAVAQAVAEVLAGGNDVAAKVVELILAGVYQVPRLPGSAAVADVELAFAQNVTTVIPAGSGFLLPEHGLELASTVDVTVTGTDTALVPVATTIATSEVNGLTPLIDVLDVIPDLVSVTLDTPLTGGQFPEDDGSYLLRARQRLRRVTNSLTVNEHFASYVLESGLASNAGTVAAWDGAVVGTAGSDEQHVTVVCYGFGGEVAAADMLRLADEMNAMVAEGVTVGVQAVRLETVAVTTTVHAEPGYTAADVQASVADAVQTYLAAHTWTPGETVRTASLTTVIDNAPGVDYVSTLDAPAADVTLDVDQVASAGTITVSVT